jgi:hypothetical protein
MSNYKFNVPAPKGTVLVESANRVVSHLTGQGYTIRSDSRPRAVTLERTGSYLSFKDHKGPHELKIAFSEREVVFDFKVVSAWKDAPSSSTFQTIVDRAKEELVKKCSSCAEYVRAEAKVCRSCQASLT